MFDDRVKERLHCAAGMLELVLGIAALGACVDHWKIKLLIRRVQRDEKIEDSIQHLVRSGVVPINFVEDNDWLGACFQRFS